MTTDPAALAKIAEWTSICGDAPEVLVAELAALGFVVARCDQVEALSDAMPPESNGAPTSLPGPRRAPD